MTLVLPAYQESIARLQYDLERLKAESPGEHLTLEHNLVLQLHNHLDTLNLLIHLDRDSFTSSPYSPGHSLVTRPKRGLLDFVGDIQSKLWGTATTKQLDDTVRRIKGALELTQSSKEHLGEVIKLTSKRIDNLADEMTIITQEMANLTVYINLGVMSIENQLISLEQLISNMLVSNQMAEMEEFCLLLHDIYLSPQDHPIGGLLARLITGPLSLSPSLLSHDLINSARLSLMYMDQEDLILTVTYYSSSDTDSLYTLLEFQELSVGVQGHGLTLSHPPKLLVTDKQNAIGYIDSECVHSVSTVFNYQQCPILPLPDHIVSCYDEILKHETVSNCSLSLKVTPLPLQKICSNEWLIDPTRVNCPGLVHSMNSLVLLSSNMTTNCTFENSNIILAASRVSKSTKSVTPLIFLYHNTTIPFTSAHYHPHVISHSLNQLHDDLLFQSQNWTHLQNLSAHELTQYVKLFSKDQQKSADYLSKLVFEKYHVSFWESAGSFIEWGLILYSTGLSTMCFLFLFCQRVNAPSILLPDEVYQAHLVQVADWIVILISLSLLVVILYQRLTRRTFLHTSLTTLMAEDIAISPGQINIYLSIALHGIDEQWRFLRVLVGGTFEPHIELAPEEEFKQWVINVIPPYRLRGRFNWSMQLHHSGIFTSYGLRHPIVKQLTIIIPASIRISPATIARVVSIYSRHDMDD